MGPSRTSTHGKKDDNYGLAYGALYNYSMSIGTRYKMTTRSGLKTKLVFEDRGSKGSFYYRFVDEGDPVIGAGSPTYKANVKSLTLPVLYSLQFGRKVSFLLDIGPHVSYQLNTRMTYYENDKRTGSSNYQDGKPFKFGVTLGFGMDIPVTNVLGITVGLLDNFNISNTGSERYPMNTNTLNLLTGVRYSLRSKS